MHPRRHPLLNELQASLVGIVPNVPVTLVGEWSSSRRRAYENEAQIGSGIGPSVEIVDTLWSGTLACSVPVACVAFLVTVESLYWAKSSPASLSLPVEVSVHSYAGYMPDRATFASTVGGAYLPSTAMRFSGAAVRDVTIETTGYATGQLVRLAQLEHAEIFVYMIPGSLLKVGRKRIWHIRSEIGATLPSGIHDLLTHGRNGRIDPGS